MSKEEDIVNFLKGRVRDIWQLEARPLLLSSIPPELNRIGMNYKDILSGVPLKKFIKENAISGGYRLVEHKTQKAKIGIVPDDVNFDFESDVATQGKENSLSTSNGDMEKIAIAFLRAISTLPQEDIDQLVIPTRILAKFFNK
jgi:hypothetical protein